VIAHRRLFTYALQPIGEAVAVGSKTQSAWAPLGIWALFRQHGLRASGSADLKDIKMLGMTSLWNGTDSGKTAIENPIPALAFGSLFCAIN